LARSLSKNLLDKHAFPSKFTLESHPITMKTIHRILLTAAFPLCTAQAAEIGQPAPDFTARNLAGESVSLADFKGRTVVLEWVNFACPFVKKHYVSGNFPELQQRYTAANVVWLTICSSAEGKQGHHEPAAMVEKAAKQGNKATHFLMDADGKVGKAYQAKVTPHMFIIDRDGKLAYDGAVDSKPSTDPADVATAEKLFVNALDAVIAGKAAANAKNKPYGCGVKY
jgi:peroxiredoxin